MKGAITSPFSYVLYILTYLDKNRTTRMHRYSFRKNVLSKKLPIFDSALTEWQNMQLNGYDRVWDCGNLKYEIVL